MLSYLPMGRHGNGLFQAASTIALALRNGVEFTMPTQTSSDKWSPLVLPHLINSKWQQGRVDVIIEEKQFHYSPLEYKPEWGNQQVMLRGYFQSEKYFLDYKEKVLDLFNFPWKLNEDFVSVHLRRTDFVELAHKHPPVPNEWYNEAMSKFPNKKFMFFSDDINYCKENWGDRNDCFFSDGTIEEDLVAISCCSDNICSASTYAWWGMYLNRNPDKKVIFPSMWFTENWDGADTKDILPEWVIKIPNY